MIITEEEFRLDPSGCLDMAERGEVTIARADGETFTIARAGAGRAHLRREERMAAVMEAASESDRHADLADAYRREIAMIVAELDNEPLLRALFAVDDIALESCPEMFRSLMEWQDPNERLFERFDDLLAELEAEDPDRGGH